jgi:hypothetical protein
MKDLAVVQLRVRRGRLSAVLLEIGHVKRRSNTVAGWNLIVARRQSQGDYLRAAKDTFSMERMRLGSMEGRRIFARYIVGEADEYARNYSGCGALCF